VFHSPTEQQARQIALALLSRAGVSPRVSVAYESKQPPTCQIVRFTNGGIELVGVLREMQRSGKPETASVRFGRRAAVHDVRSRRALGVADSATVVLEPGQAKLYALFPQEAAAGGFAVRPDAAEAAPGAEVGYAVGPRPGAAAGGGVIHVEVVRPSGEVYRPYGVSHVLKPGETAARGVVPLALNDTPGAWTIRGRDVATGYTAEAVIQVKPTAR
jgi:hypothetical protein